MASDGAHPGDRETPASPGNQESPSHSPFRLKTYIHAFSTIVLQPIDLYVCTAIMYLWSVKVGLESGYRLVVEGEALANPEEDNGWTVLATTVSAEGGTDGEILQAYQDQNATVESGFRWIKNPAAIAPVWLEKPERIAALAMLTVVGLLVYSIMQRQVRLYLRTHDQQIPGNKGLTAIPTAAVVLALFGQVVLVRLWIDEQEVVQLSGVQPQHRLVCDALGLDSSWYAVPLAQKSGRDIQTP